jgi:hypothetical protein
VDEAVEGGIEVVAAEGVEGFDVGALAGPSGRASLAGGWLGWAVWSVCVLGPDSSLRLGMTFSEASLPVALSPTLPWWQTGLEMPAIRAYLI